ncbi:SH3 domain-containing protein [Streptomyces sp. SD15]
MTTPDSAQVTSPGFRPTHVVPGDGLQAWEAPDPSRPTVPLDALLPVQLVERLGDWGRIVCANGWSAWVDGRLLVAVPQSPPEAGGALTRTDDPRPLLARAEAVLSRYRSAVEDRAAGRIDGGSFRGLTQGRRIGVVVDGESLWLYDAEHEGWVYCDGTALSTYAVDADPVPSRGSATLEQEPDAVPEPDAVRGPDAVPGPADSEPTRLVPRVPDESD